MHRVPERELVRAAPRVPPAAVTCREYRNDRASATGNLCGSVQRRLPGVRRCCVPGLLMRPEATCGSVSLLRRGIGRGSNVPRGMWLVIGPFAPHEAFPEVQIRLVLIVSLAAQRDVARLVLPAFPVGPVVMVLHAACGAAATTPPVDEGATAAVALPDRTSDRCWNSAGSPSGESSRGSVAGPSPVGERSLILQSIGE